MAKVKWLNAIIFGLICISSTSVFALDVKVDAMAGYFSIDAKTNQASGSVSNIGSYLVSVSLPFAHQFDLNVGYSLIMSKGIGGDLAYGIDAGVNYFPFTPSTSIKAIDDKSFLQVSPLIKPFFGISFHQRQYQSVQTNYAGFGLSVGMERKINAAFDLKLMTRYVSLIGPQSAQASELIFMGGISYGF
ncbi:MAG: hypothetical protein KDD50_06705 [Bdellovibrionales bacterium]|nr:hypothetical protein [Bdellovibrionales bacterium]